MNFERDLRSADSFLGGRVALSLVLLREWSRMEEGSVAAVKGCAVVLEQLKRLSIATTQSNRDGVQEEVSGVLVGCAPCCSDASMGYLYVRVSLRTQMPQEYAQLQSVVLERIGEDFTHLFVER